MNKNILAYLFAFITILVWSSTFVITKVMLESITPIQLLVIRYLIVVVFLSFVYPKFQKINWNTEWIYMIAGAFLSLYFIFENNALNQTFASNVSLIIATLPLQTSILKSIVFKRMFLSKLGVFGVIVSYIGVIVIVVSGSGVEGVKVIGDVLAFLAAFSFAVYSLFLEKTSPTIHIIEKTRKIFFYGLIVLIIYFIIVKEYQQFHMPSMNITLGLLYLGVVASGFAFILWNQAVKWIGAVNTNVFTYLIPVFTMLFSFLFINEKITWLRILGGVVIIIGIYISENNHKTKQNDSV